MSFSRLSLLFLLAASVLCGGPKRIVSLSPSTTEILYGVGAFPEVVGVSQYCSYPPEVSKLPRVGGWQTSDVEKIVALRPDLVVLTQAQAPFIADKLAAFHIHRVAVPAQSLADVFSAIRIIGSATGHPDQASALAKQTHASLDAIHAKVAKLDRPSVLLVVSRTPGTLSDLYVATPGSYLMDLVDIAGGKSAVGAERIGYGKISKEAVLRLDPDIIIDFVHGSKTTLGEHLADVWNDLPELRAVREKHVYPADDPFLPHPSQFVTRTARIFERIIHPEAAGEEER